MKSKLATLLLTKYVWGQIPSVLIQAVAAAALEDFQTGAVDQLKTLAGLGNNGALANNVNRDLLRKLGATHYASSVETVLPLKRLLAAPRRLAFAQIRYPLMLPHKVFGSIYHGYPDAWRKLLAPSERALQEFWTSLEGWPALDGSPILAIPDYKRTCVPLILHGDGVAITSAGKATVKCEK